MPEVTYKVSSGTLSLYSLTHFAVLSAAVFVHTFILEVLIDDGFGWQFEDFVFLHYDQFVIELIWYLLFIVEVFVVRANTVDCL